MAKFFQVGGSVRDALLGIPSKDIDYAVEASSFDAMRQMIVDRGGKIFLETPEFLTIRANVPGLGACDYVLCRKDGAYSDGRHPDTVQVGSLFDDLARRDFTVNAMALTEDGVLIDPHGGAGDLQNRILRTVGSAQARFSEDALRMLRAVRFAITKGFTLDIPLDMCLEDPFMVTKLYTVSPERIREELTKMFEHDTLKTLQMFSRFDYLRDVVFNGSKVWLKPTMESR